MRLHLPPCEMQHRFSSEENAAFVAAEREIIKGQNVASPALVIGPELVIDA